MRFDPVALVEAAYTQDGDDEAWLKRIVDAVASLAQDRGIVAYLCDATTPESFRWSFPAGHGNNLDIHGLTRIAQQIAQVDPELFRRVHAFGVGTRIERLPELQTAELAQVAFADALGIVATDPAGRGCIISGMSTTRITIPPRLRRTLRMVAAHLAAGSRMRPFFATPARSASVEAVLDPSARVQHADGDAKDSSARAALVDAVRRIERARGRLRRTNPDEALSLWHALVDGRWSLVDRVDSDGRRFLLARRNEPGLRDPRALAERERQVVAHALLGQSNKLIAYQLGIRESTVSSHLVRACQKLGVGSRAELLRVFAS